MDKEIISNKQGIALVVMFIMGSTMVLGVSSDAKQDAWISIIIAGITALPVTFMYARVLKLFPSRNLYDIVEILYGKVLGKFITILFVWYSIHLGALVIRNFAEYIQIVSLPETPQYVFIMALGIMCIYTVKSGIEVIGRWSIFMASIIIIMVIILNILSITQVELSALKPVLYNGFSPVLNSAGNVFTFPFGETVLFMTVLGSLNNKGNPYKVYRISLLIGGLILLIATIRNITTLGIETALILYFPVHQSISLIEIGDFVQRVEVIMSIVYLLGGIVKVGICIYSASIGFVKLINLKNYRKIVVPISLITMTLSCIIYRNTMEMFYWAVSVYKYYALPFQVIIPLAILITAEIKIRAMKKKQIVS